MPETLLPALTVAEAKVIRASVTREWLVKEYRFLYVDCGLSVEAIAQRYPGSRPHTIRRRLMAAGVTLRAPGTAHTPSFVPPALPAERPERARPMHVGRRQYQLRREGRVVGWRIQYQYCGVHFWRSFWVAIWGSKDAVRAAATSFLAALPGAQTPRRSGAQTGVHTVRSRRNSSGVLGVHRSKQGQWIAAWRFPRGSDPAFRRQVMTGYGDVARANAIAFRVAVAEALVAYYRNPVPLQPGWKAPPGTPSPPPFISRDEAERLRLAALRDSNKPFG